LSVNIKNEDIINEFNMFFNCGSIYKSLKRKTIIYRVNRLKDLNEVIMPHFKEYSLISTKKITYNLWVNCIELINKGKNKDKKDLNKLMSYYASMGRGASKKVMANFPNLKPAMKPRYNITVTDLSEY
jgi:LAGLIDADG DNA endonuclease family protein